VAKAAARFVCQECGGVHPRWSGRCDACGAWNTIVEETVPDVAPKGVSGKGGKRVSFVDLEGESEQAPRRKTGIAELDRVLGGGLVKGSAVLVGGDPGIGKSTLLLQAAAALS
jgi:DNA repair protein RadA/Sms